MNPVLKRTLTGLTVGGLVIFGSLVTPARWILPVFSAFVLLAVVEYTILFRTKLRTGGLSPLKYAPLYLLGAVLASAGPLTLALIPSYYGDAPCGVFNLGNVMMLYVIAAVKFSDVGGFAFGLTSAKLMKGGNHKMCPSISPNKSWEGMFGSVLFSCIVSLLFMPATGLGSGVSLLIGIIAATVGTAGDLVESKFKRWVGVKDSSAMKITNGMGGLLDMFDSLMFAPAVILAVLHCCS